MLLTYNLIAFQNKRIIIHFVFEREKIEHQSHGVPVFIYCCNISMPIQQRIFSPSFFHSHYLYVYTLLKTTVESLFAHNNIARFQEMLFYVKKSILIEQTDMLGTPRNSKTVYQNENDDLAVMFNFHIYLLPFAPSPPPPPPSSSFCILRSIVSLSTMKAIL